MFLRIDASGYFTNRKQFRLFAPMINFPILTKSILLTFFGNVDKLSFFPLEQHKTLYLEIGS
ncbi:hypothetical protein ASL19_00280 [Cylindrospermopsis sp. CR12]|nr:hypothetical protein ASL19_00280 [Cylindrospermopsis sp. CR12]